MKNLKKLVVFSFIIVLGFGSLAANAQEVMTQELAMPIKKGSPVSVGEIVEKSDYAQSCSVILGAMKDFYNPDSNVSGEYNSVIDLYDNEDSTISLSDLGVLSTMYYAGNESGCAAQINFDEFQANVGWCGGLEQDLMDSPDPIDLIELALISGMINAGDQLGCYNYLYHPSTTVVEPEPAPAPAPASSGVTFAIRDIETVVSCEGFDISWRTTKYSDTILDLGVETGIYDESVVNEDNTKNHSLELIDLLPNTTYFYQVRAVSSNGREISVNEKSFTTTQCEVLGEKIEAEEILIPEPKVLGEKIEKTCTYMTPDVDVLDQTEWADGSLLRGCGSKVYVIENQQKRHIKSLEELFSYIGQRIYNVKNSVLELF